MKLCRILAGLVLWLASVVTISLVSDGSLRALALSFAGAGIATGLSLAFGTDFGGGDMENAESEAP